MKKELSQILSGLGYYSGYYKLSQRNKKLLWTLLGISLGIHIFGLGIFGSWVVMKHSQEEKTVFEVPPTPMRTYEPRKLEHKVKVQKRQRSSSRPAVVPRLVSMKTSNIALPDIKMDPKLINTSFQPKFKPVQGVGLGAGLGTGYGVGGFGPGVSKFDFFGIKGRGDKIAICVDVSVSMVEEQMGGFKGFSRVKERVNSVIDALGEGGLFNVIVFADAAQTFENKLVVANDENKKRAKLFIRPFNSENNYGLSTGNVNADGKGLQAAGGSTRLDLALTACFQQGADTILVISDGAPMVLKGVSSDQIQAYNQMAQQWAQQNAAAIQEFQGGVERMKVWVPPQPARPPRKSMKEGEPDDPGAPATPGHFEEREVHRGGKKKPEPPPPPKPTYWTLTEFLQHFKMLHEAYYLQKGTKPPIVHCIGYQVDKEGDVFLKALAKEYHGKYRYVKRLK